jgi:hypothetical protein
MRTPRSGLHREPPRTAHQPPSRGAGRTPLFGLGRPHRFRLPLAGQLLRFRDLRGRHLLGASSTQSRACNVTNQTSEPASPAAKRPSTLLSNLV